MKNKEIWKDINGYKGLYQCSNFGRVRSLPRKIEVKGRFGGVHTIKGKVLTPVQDGENYLHVTLIKNNHKKDFEIHRLVAKEFLPNGIYNKSAQVDHIDGNAQNNCVSNLRWCSPQENESYSLRRRHLRAKNHLISQRIILISKTNTHIFPSFASAARYIKSKYPTINVRTTQTHLSRIASPNSNRMETYGFSCIHYDPAEPIKKEQYRINKVRKLVYSPHSMALNQNQKNIELIRDNSKHSFKNSTQAARWVKQVDSISSKLVTIRNLITAVCRGKRKHCYGFSAKYLK